MSRVGRKPVPIPSNVTVTLDGPSVAVQGPKGQLTQSFSPDLQIALQDNTVVIARQSDDRRQRAMHGLTRSLLHNMVVGVSDGWRKSLEVVGTGYRAELDGRTLVLRVGYSHEVRIAPRDDIEFAVEGALIHVRGIDRQVVGQQAADIRRVRPPEPYKGKGIRYQGEWVRRKVGKGAKK